MASVIQNNFRVRKNYAKITKIIDIPNLIDIQKQSYEKFLQKDTPVDQREDVGLQGVFKSVFPIKDFSETSSLEFVSYTLDKPKYDVDECRQRGMTYAAPIKVVIRLVVWDTNEETGSQSIRDVKEQEVYFGEIPLMTDNGTFIINGTERVVVSQLHRSPGVFYDHDRGKTHSSGKLLYQARIIPYRGSWLDFEFDPKDLIHVRIDRRRKMPATVLLKALGYTAKVLLNDGLNVGSYLRDTLVADKVATEDDAILEIYRRLRPGDPPTLDTARTLLNNLFFNPERYDLSRVGRLKLNYKFYKDDSDKVPLEVQVLTKQDIVETVR